MRATGRDAGMVMCLGQGADLHMAQLMPLPLTISCSSKSRLVLPFWFRLTRVVSDKIQEGHKAIVCVCVCGVVSMILCLAVLTQYWHLTDRTRMHDNSIYRASVASRGKRDTKIR